MNQIELKEGQLWAFSKNEYCEYSRYLYIDSVKDGRFYCRECKNGYDAEYVAHHCNYLLKDSHWELLDTKACYDLLKRYNMLDYQVKDLQSMCDKERAKAAELRNELAHMKQEKRTERHAVVYVNNMPPVVVDGGTSWSFRDDYLYVYGSNGNKIAAFMRSFVFGVSLGGEEVSK